MTQENAINHNQKATIQNRLNCDVIESTDNNQSNESERLSLWSKFGFAMGHIYNDLSACLWFSYCLLFLSKVLQRNETEAGGLILFGQVVDACATPIVGYLMDKYSNKWKWHIFGSLIVFITIPMLYAMCPMCLVWPSWWQTVYLSIVIMLFQMGWATVQVSHLAMIPEMAHKQNDRNQLSSLRNSGQFVSYIIVFMITFFVLRSDRAIEDGKTGPDDANHFRNISLIIVSIGIITTIIFQISLSFGDYGLNVKGSKINLTNSSEANTIEIRPRKNFFKTLKMYENILLYIYSRVLSTIATVYIPLWLNEITGVELVALVPLVSFIVSFLSSLPMDYLIRWCGNNSMYFLGIAITEIGCILIEINFDSSKAHFYIIASCLGAGSSITMVCSLCSIADMIANHSDQSGSVYSIVTTADKFISGIIILIIQTQHCEGESCRNHYKNVLASVNGATALLAAITLPLFLLVQKRNALILSKKRVC